MKKTVLFFAAAALFATASVNANTNTTIEDPVTVRYVLKTDVSAFCMAIVKGDAETVARMIELGTDVNEQSKGKAPLHYAARYNRADIVKMLIENGADLEAKSNTGLTAIDFAKASNATDALNVLAQYAK